MSLADLIRGNSDPVKVATAIPAIPATDGRVEAGKIAGIAKIAVASPPETKTEPEGAEAEQPLRRWLIALSDGSRFSASYSPPQTRAEVMQWYPTALSLEPEDDEPLVEQGADIPADIEAAPMAGTAVMCGTCSHWRADTIGDGSGLGSCAIGAPAIREPGSLWPNSVHRCKAHSEVAS